MSNNEPPQIKAIHDRNKEIMNKFLNENSMLKQGIKEDLNHNPMIQTHIEDTLHGIELVMDFIMNFSIVSQANENRKLEPYEQSIIYLLSSNAIKALQFEQERASFLLQKANL